MAPGGVTTRCNGGLIEITYPIFIVLFSWLLFREVHLTWTSALGGLLIMAGAAIVIAGSR